MRASLKTRQDNVVIARAMAEHFNFLSAAEFHRLSFEAQLAYLSDAKAHLQRSQSNYRWVDLFKQPRPQQETFKT